MGARHLRRGFEAREIKAIEPRAGAEQFHIQRVMLAAFQHAVAIGIPAIRVIGIPGVLHRLFHPGPKVFQPLRIAAKLPFAIGLENIAILPVHTGAERRILAPQGNLRAEAQAARLIQIIGKVALAQAALQTREQKRHGIGVIPHVRAAALARSLGAVQPFPAVERAVWQADAGGRFQHGHGG